MLTATATGPFRIYKMPQLAPARRLCAFIDGLCAEGPATVGELGVMTPALQPCPCNLSALGIGILVDLMALGSMITRSEAARRTRPAFSR